MNMKDDVVENLDVFKGGQVVVQLQPGIHFHLLHPDRQDFFTEFRILAAGYQQVTFQQVGGRGIDPVREFNLQFSLLNIPDNLSCAFMPKEYSFSRIESNTFSSGSSSK